MPITPLYIYRKALRTLGQGHQTRATSDTGTTPKYHPPRDWTRPSILLGRCLCWPQSWNRGSCPFQSEERAAAVKLHWPVATGGPMTRGQLRSKPADEVLSRPLPRSLRHFHFPFGSPVRLLNRDAVTTPDCIRDAT